MVPSLAVQYTAPLSVATARGWTPRVMSAVALELPALP